MAELKTHKRLVKWGHGFGLRISREEARRLGAREKTALEVQVRTADEPLDVETLPMVRLGKNASRDHDKIFAEGS